MTWFPTDYYKESPCHIGIAHRFLVLLLLLVLGPNLLATEDGGHALGLDHAIDFNRDVRPILSEKCFHCHGPDQATREAGLRLDLAESALSVIAKGNAHQSELVQRIESTDSDDRMPPKNARKQLTSEEKQTLRNWIDQGAGFSKHWSFVPVVRPNVPNSAVESNETANEYAQWSQNPIDDFVLSRMRIEINRNGRCIKPVERADRETLLRRITLDLIGLPPSKISRELFHAEPSLDLAIDRLIDRLMQNPAYGEHMALPWLDASRYADTDGYQNDRYRYQHVWRDWLIDAYNRNMPYDQFVIEQLAGDRLKNATLRQQIATGFCRNHRINSEDGSIPEEWRVENVVDRVDTFGTVMLGLTISCARCHDHKYDPISQKEYYQLFAYFNSVAEWGVGPNNGNSPPFIEVPESWPNLSPKEDRLMIPDPVELRASRKAEGNGLKRPQAGSPKTVMIMHELPEPRETYVLIRGQYNAVDKTQVIRPDVPQALKSESKSSPQNRLELAQWLFHAKNPLTARVEVNRIWQQFFGRGLVETIENLGSQGAMPSHPELLDWLASEFVRSGWNRQWIQRLILTSATYQQSSTASAEDYRLDPTNRLLLRGPRHRLRGFTLRDQALAVSGLMVTDVGGPSVKPYMPPKIWSAISNNRYKQDVGGALFRRSLYTYWRRTIPPPTMVNFNAAARDVCSVRTETTNTPLQALSLMNNVVFIEVARVLAERTVLADFRHVPNQKRGPAKQKTSGSLDDSWVRRIIASMFSRVCGRPLSENELVVLVDAYRKFHEEYKHDVNAATRLLSVGESPRSNELKASDHAALTMVASIIFNLDEAVTKE